jgi:hypothetical protein
MSITVLQVGNFAVFMAISAVQQITQIVMTWKRQINVPGEGFIKIVSVQQQSRQILCTVIGVRKNYVRQNNLCFVY